MAKLTIRITHVAWRDGRPRFMPGPQLREEGWKGEDLRHGPALRGRMTGPWYTAEEALIWAQAREKAIEARRAELAAAKAQRKRRPAFAAPAAARIGLSIDELFERYWKSPRMAGEDVVDGKRRQKAASPNTVKDYKAKAAALAKFDAEFCCLPVDALSSIIVYDLYERLWTAKGLAMARGTVAVLSAAIGWGIKRGLVKLGSNPCLGLKLETPAPRVRCLTPVEVLRLVAAADALGRPEIGDAIVLGVWTGQRQIDRLAIADGGVLDGRRVFRQTKTKAVVMIPDAPELRARLAAARERRLSWRVVPVELIVDERQRKPWAPRTMPTSSPASAPPPSPASPTRRPAPCWSSRCRASPTRATRTCATRP
jgi:hypothetical protein